MKNSKTILAILTVFLIVLCINTFHNHLWGPDEPREMEISRETLITGNYVTAHFNTIPFVEKPPLYYDLAALVSSIYLHPGSARLVSALLGFLMILALFCFARKKYNLPIALGACALCISMPQFYRAAHWILVDIGVGAFVTLSIVLYGFWTMQKKKSNCLLALFFFSAALAFLTKGTITIVYLGIIILPFMIYKKRWMPFPINLTLLCFLIPVGIWLWFFYQEGGIYYLHEHFVNNIFGRLLHIKFHLAGSPVTISDVGHDTRWSFYFERFPNMFGAAIAVIPFALIHAWRQFGIPFFRWHLSGRIQKYWDILTAPKSPLTQEQKDLLIYILIWSFVPVFFLSIPSIKEVTYLLPSYSGLALFLMIYLSDRLDWNEIQTSEMRWSFITPLLLFAVAAQLIAPFSLLAFSILFGIIYLFMIVLLIRFIRQKKYPAVMILILSGMIGGVIFGNTPEIMKRTRLDRKCYCEVAKIVWQKTGKRPLYIYDTDESIRGAIPFYGNRTVLNISGNALTDLMKCDKPHGILLCEDHLNNFLKNPQMRPLIQNYKIEPVGYPEKAGTFVLLLSGKENH